MSVYGAIKSVLSWYGVLSPQFQARFYSNVSVLLAIWCVGVLFCRCFGLCTFRYVDVFGVSTFWSVDVSECRWFGLSTLQSFDVLVLRRFGVSAFWSVDILECQRIDLSTFWSIQISICRSFNLSRFGVSTLWYSYVFPVGVYNRFI